MWRLIYHFCTILQKLKENNGKKWDFTESNNDFYYLAYQLIAEKNIIFSK
jgi:hypothetical protein